MQNKDKSILWGKPTFNAFLNIFHIKDRNGRFSPLCSPLFVDVLLVPALLS